MQSVDWVSAKNGPCGSQTTEIKEFGTGSRYCPGDLQLALRLVHRGV